jgi:hypothetical protein
VAAVHNLEKGDLGVASQVNVLGAVSYKLHQTSSCHLWVLYLDNTK